MATTTTTPVRRTRGELVNRDRCAAILGVARTTLDAWVRRGCPVHSPSGRKGVPAEFDTAAVFAWARDNADPAAGPGEGSGGERGTGALVLEVERARLAKEQADQAAMRNAIMRDEFLRADHVTSAVASAFSRVRGRLLALPTKAAPRLVGMARPGPIQALLTEYVHEALNELANTRVVAASGAEVELADAPPPREPA